MLPKKNRLPLRLELNQLKVSAQRFRSGSFTLLLLANGSKKPPRFAFVISKKVSKKAVARNKIKRQLARSVLSLLPDIKEGIRAVFLVKSQIIGHSYGEIEGEVKTIFKKAGVI